MKKLREMLAKSRKQNDGYLTIELTLVFQVLFFSLMLILFMGMVLYQEVKLQSLSLIHIFLRAGRKYLHRGVCRAQAS